MALDIRQRIAGKLRDLVAEPLERGGHEAVTLAVAARKGGVGKTTTSINLAVGYAQQRGLKVLLIDLDPQAHVGAALRTHTPAGTGYLSDVLMGRCREVSEVAYRSPWGHLDLVGNDKSLAETEMLLSTKIGKEFLLDGALELTRTHYDLIILDCPPNLGTLTLNALCAADQLLIPCDMSVLALEGVGDMLLTVETLRTRLNRSLNVAGIVATRVDSRATRMNAEIEASFEDLFGDTLLQTKIPQNSAINRAHLAGKPIYEYDRRSSGALAYEKLLAELTEGLGLGRLPPMHANVPSQDN